ncbi:unnamed protein product [Tetraodon nigroviridis]|uniref:Chromosome 6 SCAF14737, whole genome shotgun sequence n=1 Tax=Tetraodon nigroviridis TaxID=99883 RepID=Q4S522_TETNG|nr:unnamed protein product [Tetraodon nigroviridis]
MPHASITAASGATGGQLSAWGSSPLGQLEPSISPPAQFTPVASVCEGLTSNTAWVESHQTGSSVGCLPVSPPASDARREFSTDETRLRFSVVRHRQGKRFSCGGGSVRPESQTKAPSSYCTRPEGARRGEFVQISFAHRFTGMISRRAHGSSRRSRMFQWCGHGLLRILGEDEEIQQVEPEGAPSVLESSASVALWP